MAREDYAADAISTAILNFATRLRRLGLVDRQNPGVPDFLADPLTGEVMPVIHTADATYSTQGGQLIEQREGAGRIRYRHLDNDGKPIEDWQDAPPPPSHSNLN
jgi:hypothetical protein